MMQVEVSSRAGIDTLKRIACGVQSFPLIGVTWQGANGTKIVLIELHAYHSTARMRGTGVSVALFTAETFEPVVGGWTVVLEGLTCLFDTVIGHLANLAGLWTTTGDYPTFVIDEGVDDIGVERLGRVYFAWQGWVLPHSAVLDYCGESYVEAGYRPGHGRRRRSDSVPLQGGSSTARRVLYCDDVHFHWRDGWSS